MKISSFLGVTACLMLSSLPAIAGYPETRGWNCKSGYQKNGDNNYCFNSSSSYYPETKWNCVYGFTKQGNTCVRD